MRFCSPWPLAIPVLLAAAGACGGSDDAQAPTDPPTDDGEAVVPGCRDRSLDPTGALYRVCFPEDWNGELVVYAHGYLEPGRALSIPDDEIDGYAVAVLVNGLGYAYAATSYRANGLVADVAVEDVAQVAEAVRRLYRPDPVRTYLVGVSEGGLVAALALERRSEIFDGAVAACGPVGDFARQIDYFGDFRVVFDYLFPGVIPGNAVEVPDSVRARWDERYVPAIVDALLADLSAAGQLVAVTGAPVDPADLSSVGATVIGVLWYNIFATEDAQERVGGQPYDNTGRVYVGSADDEALNHGVSRFAADPEARRNIDRFQTSGRLAAPLVTLHTTGDPIVLFEQEPLYAAKVAGVGASAFLLQRTVSRYGHCAFTRDELLAAFSGLTGRVTASTR